MNSKIFLISLLIIPSIAFLSCKDNSNKIIISQLETINSTKYYLNIDNDYIKSPHNIKLLNDSIVLVLEQNDLLT